MTIIILVASSSFQFGLVARSSWDTTAVSSSEPFSAGPEHQPANRRGQRFAVILRVHQPAVDHDHFAEILGQTLVDPEQRGSLRRVKIGGALADGPAILAAPGVDVFMGDQVGDPAFASGTVDEVALATPLRLEEDAPVPGGPARRCT